MIELTFTGYEESMSEDESFTVTASSYEHAAEKIAELQDGEDEMIAPERLIILWPWGFPDLKKTYKVAANIVYSTCEEVTCGCENV